MRRPPGPGRRRCATAVLLAVSLLAAPAVAVGTAAPAGAEAPGPYAPPVDGVVADPFRAPANPYAAGNRGLEYRTATGAEVRAAGPGEVTFAGQVGGALHVVVLHGDGLRTSYSFLAGAVVTRGQRVGRGDVVGTSTGSIHFGVRAGERYVDPVLLLAGGPVEVHLVPLADRRPRSVADERRSLHEALRAAGALASSAAGAAGWLVDRSAGAAVAHARRRAELPLTLVRAVAEARRGSDRLAASQRGCTPAGTRPPPRPSGRRIAVLVAGFGSSGGDAEVLDVDTGALGYGAEDVAQLSYRGGRVAGFGALDGVPTSSYGPTDAVGDLQVAAQHLTRLLADVAAAHPGVPVDVIAHSQGGVVARAALEGGPPGQVANLVTLGSPHRGATLATLALQLDLDAERSRLGGALADVSGGAVDPRAPAVAQLAAGSAFLGDPDRGAPPGVRMTSLAASGDLVVPGLSSVVAGATSVLVPLVGPAAHQRLPGSAEVHRELVLALAGAGPTCAPGPALVARAATAAAVGALEQATGTAAGPTVRLVDDLAAATTAAVALAAG